MPLRDWQRNRTFHTLIFQCVFYPRGLLMDHKLKLHLLEEKFAISKLPQFAEIPSVFTKGEMCFVMRTDQDLTVICPEFMAPNNVQQEAGYRCIRVLGDAQTKTVGIISSLVQPLASAGISIFVASTFTTAHIFLMEEHLVEATQALQHAGHVFVHEE
jgi:hypothetical protein